MLKPPSFPTYLSDKQVAARYGVTRVTVWRWSKEGTFPVPVHLSSGCTRWLLSDLENWESRCAEGAA